MVVVKKMNAVGMKALHARVQEIKPTVWLHTVYRWRRALLNGRGVIDDTKNLLIQATEGTAHAIYWTDFTPAKSDAKAA